MSITEQLELIANGIDPMTGEVFDTNFFSENDLCNNAILRLTHLAFPKMKLPKYRSVNKLNRPVDKIFKELKAWRLETARSIGYSAYYIFTDKELHDIAAGDAVQKEDLLQIKGFDQKKYDLYADDVYDILKPYIKRESDHL